MRKPTLVATIGSAAALMAGCGNSSSSSSPPPPPAAPDTSRCQDASAVAAEISQGLDSVVTIRAAQAVRSHDYSKVWFVAADLEGDGLEGSDDYAVWATNKLDGNGSVFSAESVAEEFSDWGMIPGGNAIGSDGVSEAEDCVQAQLG